MSKIVRIGTPATFLSERPCGHPGEQQAIATSTGTCAKYRVFAEEELRRKDYPGRAAGVIYAVFDVVEDESYLGREWDGAKLMEVIKEYEARLKHRSNDPPLGHDSANPRASVCASS